MPRCGVQLQSTVARKRNFTGFVDKRGNLEQTPFETKVEGGAGGLVSLRKTVVENLDYPPS